jgi:hypothetical protein
MAKTLYHGEFVKMGAVTVTVKSDVLQSQFKGKPDYVVLEIDGEDRNYNTENEECAEFFADQKGVAMVIEASGRDDDAVITYIGEPDPADERPARRGREDRDRGRGKPPRAKGPPAARGRAASAPDDRGRGKETPARDDAPQGQPAPQPTRSCKPPPKPEETPEQKLVRTRVHANKVANVWLVAYKAGCYARTQVKEQLGIELPAEQFQTCVSTICVQLEKDGFHHFMPTGVMDIRPEKKEPEPKDKDKDTKKEGK